jgi:cysteine desulfurase
MTIYADYAGSSDLSKDVKEYLLNRITEGPFANPNAIHYLGRTLMSGLSKAREICAKNIGASPDQLIFNSGSTEGVTTVFHSLLENNNTKKTIVISAIEHPCVSNASKYYKEKKGFNQIIIPVTKEGIIDINFLQKTINEYHSDIALVSIMAANNETGVIQPIEKISALIGKHHIPLSISGKYLLIFPPLKLTMLFYPVTKSVLSPVLDFWLPKILQLYLLY